MKISARNQLMGVIKRIEGLGLKAVGEAYAVIKASSVMVAAN